MADKLYTMIHDLYTVHQKVVGMNQNSLSSISPADSGSAATSWDNSGSELTTSTTDATTTGPSLDTIYPYPCSAAIPMRKLPMAEVSLSTSDYTLEQALAYQSSLTSNATTTTTNDASNTNSTGFLQNMRSRSLFNDQSLSPFDLWIQQQQQTKKPS